MRERFHEVGERFLVNRRTIFCYRRKVAYNWRKIPCIQERFSAAE